jgi:hypothetical protein
MRVTPELSRTGHGCWLRSRPLLIEGVDHSFIGSRPAVTRETSVNALRATVDFFDCQLRLETFRRMCGNALTAHGGNVTVPP